MNNKQNDLIGAVIDGYKYFNAVIRSREVVDGGIAPVGSGVLINQDDQVNIAKCGKRTVYGVVVKSFLTDGVIPDEVSQDTVNVMEFGRVIVPVKGGVVLIRGDKVCPSPSGDGTWVKVGEPEVGIRYPVVSEATNKIRSGLNTAIIEVKN